MGEWRTLFPRHGRRDPWVIYVDSSRVTRHEATDPNRTGDLTPQLPNLALLGTVAISGGVASLGNPWTAVTLPSSVTPPCNAVTTSSASFAPAFDW